MPPWQNTKLIFLAGMPVKSPVALYAAMVTSLPAGPKSALPRTKALAFSVLPVEFSTAKLYAPGYALFIRSATPL